MLIKDAIEKAVILLTNSTNNDNVVLTKKEAIKDAEDILISVLRITREQLIIQHKHELPSVYENIFFSNINDRKKGKPLGYITRNAVFYNYNFFVNESCLIPRIDSEILVEKAEKYIINLLNHQAKGKNDSIGDITIKIADICCGSGCLGISLVKSILEKQQKLKNFNISIELTLLDISAPAIRVAQLNSQILLSKYADNVRVKYIVCDVLQNGIGNDKYDIILCNPPYIETKIIEKLEKQVKDYEPHLALDGGEDGLKFYRAFQQILQSQRQKYVNTNNTFLFDKQIAFFEIGYNQSKDVCKIFSNAGFEVNVIKDYGNKDRVVIVR